MLPDAENRTIVSLFVWRERERVYLPQHKEQTYKNILNKSTVDTITERDGQSDGRTDGRNPSGYYSALHCEQC